MCYDGFSFGSCEELAIVRVRRCGFRKGLRVCDEFVFGTAGFRNLISLLFARIFGSQYAPFCCSGYRKWPCMSHLDICNTSYGNKKGRDSNCQFDSRPLKVGNRLDPGVCRWSVTHPWKAHNESYKFALDLIPIQGLRKEL
jgi:hypothetical protein